MSALDAFLWTLTAWMWLLMAGVLTALGVTIWDDVKRRRASKAPKDLSSDLHVIVGASSAPKEPATLHVIRPSETPKESA